MSDEGQDRIGSDKGEGVSRRVGNAERDEAIAQLSQHWQAGRLDPGEHELRVTRARAAVTQADLDDLFTDLPQPGRAPESTGAATTGVRGLLTNKRETIMALVPFAATALFFTMGYNWLWFLMIPVMGILLYGPEGNRNPGQGRRARRGRGEDH